MSDDVAAQVAAYWDDRAALFDEEPDHGLRDAGVRAAWIERFRAWLAAPPCDVADLGCGTGSLAVLLAQAGHRVTGIDLASAMVDHARRKASAARVAARFHQGDAAAPPIVPAAVDVVLVRHLVWTLPDPHRAIATWVGLLRPGGRLVLIEGRWSNSGAEPARPHGTVRHAMPWYGGVDAATLRAAVAPLVAHLVVHDLGADDRLWGRHVTDERFGLVARTHRQ